MSIIVTSNKFDFYYFYDFVDKSEHNQQLVIREKLKYLQLQQSENQSVTILITVSVIFQIIMPNLFWVQFFSVFNISQTEQLIESSRK